MRISLFAFAIILIITLFFLGRNLTPMPTLDRPIVTVNAHILDRYVGYIRDNNLADIENRAREREYSDRMPSYLTAPAANDNPNAPGGIIVNYDHPDCPVTLPAGRQFMFGQTGGIIDHIGGFFPLEPLSWDDMQAEILRLIAVFDNAGWVRSRGQHGPDIGIRTEITPEHLAVFPPNTPKWVNIGFWEQCDNSYIKVQVQVRHYNSSSPGSFIPPAPLSDPLDPFAEDQFLFLVRFRIDQYSPVHNELTLLRNMRRIDVNGDPDEAIPLATWLDDPDWRPEGWQGIYVP